MNEERCSGALLLSSRARRIDLVLTDKELRDEISEQVLADEPGMVRMGGVRVCFIRASLAGPTREPIWPPGRHSVRRNPTSGRSSPAFWPSLTPWQQWMTCSGYLSARRRAPFGWRWVSRCPASSRMSNLVVRFTNNVADSADFW